MNNNDLFLNGKRIENVLTPYNSLLLRCIHSFEETDNFHDTDFADLCNENINLENDIISFNNKVKEYNLLYELNNNNEVDNG